MRDNFSEEVKKKLCDRVGSKCSNPRCMVETKGSAGNQNVTNTGVASHITAASIGGPRYDESLTPEQRKSFSNGIWLCAKCAKMIDDDPETYSVELLNKWKSDAEYKQKLKIEGRELKKDNDNNDIRILLNQILFEINVMFDKAQYAKNYYDSNFCNLVSMSELDNVICDHFFLHKNALHDIALFQENSHSLFNIISKNELFLPDDLVNLIRDYADLFSFTYSDDGGLGIDNDFYSQMIKCLVQNFDSISRNFKKIKEKCRELVSQ